MDITKKRFLSLSLQTQHKIACEALQAIALGNREKSSFYKEIEAWLELPSLSFQSYEEICDRFHFHKQKGNLPISEHSLLYLKKEDKESLEPFLPIHIALCSLRSAFNVGSIVRTTEAFRLGTLHCLGSTPAPSHSKVQKTSMGTSPLVPFHINTDLLSLPKPWVALETASPSTPIEDFIFPSSCTLFLGNEEFGIPKEILTQCDFTVEISLFGSKNSLNVATAFAIAAHKIRTQKKTL